MLIEDKPHTEDLEKESNKQGRIRRLARLNNSESGTAEYLEGQIEFDQKCPEVFHNNQLKTNRMNKLAASR